MDRIRIFYLHQQYLQQAITAEEWLEFKQVLANAGAKKLLAELLDENWNKISAHQIADLDSDRFEKAYNHIISQQQPKRAAFKLFQRIAVAATVALMIFSAGLFYYSNQHHKSRYYSNDITPGVTGATLTLSNGKKIKLDQTIHGELAKESGVSITKKGNGEIVYEIKSGKGEQLSKINTLSTDKGETYALILPDQSKVWLNSASSLTYSTSFNGSGPRRVKLDGEAYFEIYKDKAHPFIVESKGQEVEVLGTHFNVNAYTNEPVIKTTLIEGLVKVTAMPLKATDGLDKTAQLVFLKPDQQAVMDGKGFKVKSADTEEALAWINGKFIFRNEDLASIMRRVSLWYNVEVEYVGDVSDLIYWGAISRTTNISSVLDYFSKTGNVEFKIQGKKITVIKQMN